MKEYQYYGILAAIWSCGIVGSTSISGSAICALLAVLNMAVMFMSKDK